MARSTSRRILRFFLRAVGVLVLLILAAAILIPVLFKEDIDRAIQQAINDNVNAEVAYNDLSLGIFAHFPDITVELEGLQVVGKAPFAHDTLISCERFEVVADFWSVLGGELFVVNRIGLIRPRMNVIVLPDGQANYDIALPDSGATPDTAAADTAAAPLNLQLQGYEIVKADVRYTDYAGGLAVAVQQLTHRGSGNFLDDVIELSTQTQAASVRFVQDDVSYLKGVKLEADLNATLDLPNQSYTLRDNAIRLNELALHADGNVQLTEQATVLDLTFGALETEFRNILSLVPGVYTQDFNNLQTSGSLVLDGQLKGRMTDTEFPAFDVKLGVANARLQYPDLPAAIEGINLDLHAFNTTSDLDATTVHLKQFVANVGGNPIEARVLLEGLTRMAFDASVKADADLATLTQIVPLPGTELKGKLKLDATAKGLLSEESLPALEGNLQLTEGYYHSGDVPEALHDIRIEASATNPTGDLADTKLTVPAFHVEVGKQPIDGRLSVENLDNPAYDLALKGELNLAKLAEILELTGMELAGDLQMDIATQGRLSDIEAANYANLPASGSLTARNVTYRDAAALPQGLAVPTADLAFDPGSIALTNFTGQLGRSDFALEGSLRNYMGYFLKSDGILQATLDVRSKSLDLNEWLGGESVEAEAEAPADDAPIDAFEVPADIDFLMGMQVQQVLYQELVIENFTGGVELVNETVKLTQTRFSTLGGQFGLSGSYNSQQIAQPTIALDLDIQNLDIQQADQHFSLIQTFVPMAKHAKGTFSTQFDLNGTLDRFLDPVYETFQGYGKVQTNQVVIERAPLFERLAQVTKVKKLNSIELNDLNISAFITDGRLFIEPLETQFDAYLLTTSGSTGLDQTIDYDLVLNAPTGELGAAATQAIGELINREVDRPERIIFTVKATGPSSAPKLKLINTETENGSVEGQGQNALDEAKAKLDAERAAAEARAREEADRLRREADAQRKAAEQRAAAEQERLKREAKQRQQEAERKAREEAELRRRQAEEEANKKAKELRNRLPF